MMESEGKRMTILLEQYLTSNALVSSVGLSAQPLQLPHLISLPPLPMSAYSIFSQFGLWGIFSTCRQAGTHAAK